MESVGVLWKNKKDDKTYLSGNMLGGIKVLIYPVKKKLKKNSPDYTISIEYPCNCSNKKDSKKDVSGVVKVTHEDI